MPLFQVRRLHGGFGPSRDRHVVPQVSPGRPPELRLLHHQIAQPQPSQVTHPPSPLPLSFLLVSYGSYHKELFNLMAFLSIVLCDLFNIENTY